MATGSSGEIRRGFLKFSGDPGDYVGWRTLQTSLFMKDKLHKVLLGVEKAPSNPGPSAMQDQTSAYQSALEGYQDENGQIFTRLMLATSETGGYQSAASQTVQAYAPIGSSHNGDSLTADHDFDPANVIQDMRRICTELAVYNDTVADHRKTSLPDDKYKEFKTGLLCGQATRSVVSLEEVADRATLFHAMHIRARWTRTGSWNNSSNRNNGSTRGNNSNDQNHGATSGDGAGASSDNRSSGRPNHMQQERGYNRDGVCSYCHNSTEHTWTNCPLRTSNATRFSNREHQPQQQVNTTAEATTQAWLTHARAVDLTLESFDIAVGDPEQVPFAPAASTPEEASDAKVGQVLAAPPTASLQLLERAAPLQVPIAPATAKETEEPAASYEQEKDPPAAIQHKELVAYTNILRAVDKTAPAENTRVFIDTAVSGHTVSGESPVSQHVVDLVDCDVRIEGSCGASSATKKATLKFKLKNGKGQPVPIELEGLLVRDLGANIFSVGAFDDEGVKTDLLSAPPALRTRNLSFPISTVEVPRMCVVNLILDDLNLDLPTSPLVFRADTDAGDWHRRMGHCNARALKQLSDREGTGIKFTNNRPGDCEVCDHIAMFTYDKSRMRWGIPLKTKDEVTVALETLIKEVADPGVYIGKILCDGAADFKGRFLAMCRSFRIAVETSPPYVPQGNAVAERGFGTVIGAARSLMLGAPHLLRQLWAEAVKAAIYIKNRTPWRQWDPAELLKITNSAEPSFREGDARDVARPMHGSDLFPEQGQISQPRIITGAETRDEEPELADTNDGPDEEPPAVFETEYALVIGAEIGNLGQGIPGQLGYMPADPPNYRAAVNGPDAVGWMKSMEEENRSLLDHDVYEWVDPRRDARIIPSKYIYEWKYNEAGIADGVPPREDGTGIETSVHHSPGRILVRKRESQTSLEAQSVALGVAFSPKGWWGTLHDFLLRIGFVESTAEPCLYILDDGDLLLLVYVDDILLTGEGENKVLSKVDQLNERFETVDLGGVRFLLGMGINRDRAAGTILLEQEAYISAVLDKFDMADARPTTSPSEARPVSVLEDEELLAEDTTYFRSATGSLFYLSRCTRPDITHSVMVLMRSMAKSGPRAMQKLKRVLRYLKGTISIGVRYGEDAEDGNVITAFVDSDFAGDLDKGYYTTGVVLYFAGGPVERTSSKQTVVTTSSVEAEFVALSKGCNIIKYFRQNTINQTQEEATVVWEDNSGALKLTRSFRITPRTKHIDVKFYHVWSLVADGVVDVKQRSTSYQKADVFTKGLNPSEFLRARGMLLGV
ncbi:unnamed protein product [Ectocarpus sp. CCAP 1310/34]|nr:unnamed protein product [Ectocarpus sp. CCAP 1310/34]